MKQADTRGMARPRARRRRIAFLLVLLLLASLPSLLERLNRAAPCTPGEEMVKSPTVRQEDRPERIKQVSKLLISTTFPFHFLWITALSLLFVVTVADLLMKVTFTCCAFGVALVTTHKRLGHTFILLVSI